MDEQWEMFEPDVDYQLSLKPSEFFAHNCYAVVDCSELAKAEGAVTCCSLVFEARSCQRANWLWLGAATGMIE